MGLLKGLHEAEGQRIASQPLPACTPLCTLVARDAMQAQLARTVATSLAGG
jgi:hypothetical protein